MLHKNKSECIIMQRKIKLLVKKYFTNVKNCTIIVKTH